MTETLKKLAGEVEGLAATLMVCGWDRVYVARLLAAMERIREEAHQLVWLEVVGRAETLLSILHEFVQDSPTLEHFQPVLQSAVNLSALLGQDQAVSSCPGQFWDSHQHLALLRNSLDVHSIVSITAADGTIIDVNQKFCEISGYTKSELIGRNHRVIKSGYHPKSFFTDMWRTILSGRIWQGDIQNRKKSGGHYWLQSTILPILDAEGRPERFFSIRTDITLQKQTLIETCANLMDTARASNFQEREADDIARRLEQSEQALTNKTEFIAKMSHQLRELLNIILGHSQLLQLQYGGDAATCEQVGEITKAGEKLTRLVDRLLDQGGDVLSVSGHNGDMASKTVSQNFAQIAANPSHLILVVEDDPVNQSVLRQQLNVLGVNAHIANNGREALSHWSSGSYGLMLTDINMPDLNGLDLTLSIRAAEQGTAKHLPIIGITASSDPDDLRACFQAGMDDILPKPIELGGLRQMLGRWLKITWQPGLAVTPTPIIKPSDDNNNPVLDTGYLIDFAGGLESGKLHGLLDLFITSARAEMVLCQQYLRQNDAQALALSMHKLKSSSQSIGALRFSNLSKQIETVVREGCMADAEPLFHELGQALVDIEHAGIDPVQFADVAKTSNYSVTSAEILDGLKHNEFDVYFQPIVDAFTLQPVGVEALARWRREDAVLQADAFIQAAEQYKLISRLSEVLLIKAFFGGVRLAEAGLKLDISVNLSAQMLLDVNLPDFIQASLHATGLQAENVILEITEIGLMAVLPQTLDAITRLRQKGFRLSIDDFGIGHSSIGQLQGIPFSELKLDMPFIQGAANNTNFRAMLSAGMDMATKLKFTTVAKGVETQDGLDLARSLGCNQVQGCFIAKPMPIGELMAWLPIGQKIDC